MAQYKCEVCEFIYDEEKEGILWNDLPDDWACPICGTAKKYFSPVEDTPAEEKPPEPAQEKKQPWESLLIFKKPLLQ